jgi:hypothetical protein
MGNIFAQLAINIPTPLVIVAVNVQGAADINIDENHDGLLKEALANAALPLSLSAAVGANALAQDLANGGAMTKALLADFGIAASSSAGITVGDPDNIISATITLSRASGIYTGTNNPRFYFAGISTNNGLTGTFLQQYVQYLQPTQTFSFDGVAMPGSFDTSFTANYTYFGFSATTTTELIAHNIGTPAFSLTAKIDGNLNFLNAANVTVSGVINNQGVFHITGTADVTIAGFTVSKASILVTKAGIALNGTLNLPGIATAKVVAGSTTNGNFILHGTASTNWGIPFAPTVTATLTLSNTGLKTSTTVEFLGQQAHLNGSIQTNFDYSLTGGINAGFSFAGISPHAVVHVTLANAGGSTSLGGDFDLRFSVLGAAFNVNAMITLAFAGLGIPVYSGSATVSARAGIISASASVAVANNALVIDLPLLPVVTIPLPF